MTVSYGRPDALELITAVKDFLGDEVMPAVDGQLAFHVRVAVNALDISLRELVATSAQGEKHGRALAKFGCSDEAELAESIRLGKFDDRYDELSTALRLMIEDKIKVVNPRYIEP